MIKVKKVLFPYNGALPDFIHRPIKAFKWSKFFSKEMKVRLDVVEKFYVPRYHLTKFYATVEREKIYFNAKVINELYNLSNDVKYPGHELINN